MAGKLPISKEKSPKSAKTRARKMTETETLGILEAIEALVSDQLQVVSYKWLSRNFLVSSNAAKRLLQDLVEKCGSGLEIVYTLSGWLKNNPSTYHIRLVSGPQLTEAKEDFAGNCSVEVYSVQASIPKDPAALWNAEFVQAEELFKQPCNIDNCLRDNRFCGISNSFVKRNVDGNPTSIAVPQAKTVGLSGISKVDFQSPTVVKDVKIENNSGMVPDHPIKPTAEKEKGLSVPVNRKKVDNDKSTSGAGGSLASLWGRAPGNSKTNSAATVSSDAPKSSEEAFAGVGDADDEVKDVNIKRASNGDGRKRRVVFDYSDEEENEDVISLASPNTPKGKSRLDTKPSTKASIAEGQDSESNEEAESLPRAGDEKESFASKNVNGDFTSTEKIEVCGSEADATRKDEVMGAPSSPKRRRILKTRIDERGREVCEAVWEGEVTDTKKIQSDAEKKEDSTIANKSDNQTSINNRSLAPKKSAAVGATAPLNAVGKGGSKKGGNVKDPKQGNILSFFRKV